MGKYIQKRRRRWYAVLEIPAALRQKFGGKPRFVQSLQTESETVAERRAAMVVGAWKKEIAEARGQPDENDALYWRALLKKEQDPKRRARILEMIHEAAELVGMETIEEIGMDPTSSPEARKFYAEAVGWTTPTREHVDEWLESQKRLSDRTRVIYKNDVLRFAAEFENLVDVTRPGVRRWVDRLMREDDLSVRSVRRILAPVRSYWKYLARAGAVPEDHDPFAKLDLGRDETDGGWVPLTPEDVVVLMQGARKIGDEELADVIDVARWTGARIEEICSLKVTNLKGDWFAIEDAKTQAGVREVPVHPKLAPTLKRLTGKRAEGPLFHHLKVDKFGQRSRALGMRFSKLKTALGFGERQVFHSIRKTVATQLENAHVPEGVAADILGHEKPTMTYGVYSGGASMKTKRDAILKLKYPD